MEMTIRFPNLGVEVTDLGRSLRIFGVEITYGGIVIAAGLLLALAFVVLEAKRRGENPNDYLGLIITALVTGLVGARLYYVAFSWNLYKGDIGEILNFRQGGLGFYGALLGGILGGALYCAVRRLSFPKMADTASMGILVAQIIGRWADFFNRESFGDYTNSVFAMQLPLAMVRSQDVSDTMRENLVTVNGTAFIQAHPVFFYESVFCLLLFLLLLAWKRTKRFDGEVFLRYLAGYGLGRFFLEWLRTDSLLLPGTEIPAAMVISVLLFVIGVVGVSVQGSMAKKRALLKKRRREEKYAAEENAAREAQKEDDALWERLRLEKTQGKAESSEPEPANNVQQNAGDTSGSVEDTRTAAGNMPEFAENVQANTGNMSEFAKNVQANVRSISESVEKMPQKDSALPDSTPADEAESPDPKPEGPEPEPSDEPQA